MGLDWKDIAASLAAGWIVGLSWFFKRLQNEVDGKANKDEFRDELELGRQSRAKIHEKLDDIAERVSHMEGRVRR